ARARSMSAASFLAATDASLAVSAAGFSRAGLTAVGFLADARLTGIGAAPLRAGFAVTFAATVLRADIDLIPLLDPFVFPPLELGIGDAFAGLDIVLVAVPGAHEVKFGVGEIQAPRGLVGHDALLHLGDRQPLAGWSSLV